MRSIPFIRSLLFALVMLAISAASFAQIAVSITIAPPALPVYEQPLCPGEGYIWTPGYWAYGDDDYYWVPGTWVFAPEVGLLWTPGYWAWSGDSFVFSEGYWAPRVGFYGGIDYGYGYFGHGYEGGRWDNGRFYYNRSVNNVSTTTVHNFYNTTVINNATVSRVSYNGGDGGINARPRPDEEAVAHDRHIPPVAVQTRHVEAARANSQLRASVNEGKPPVAATPKPGALNDRAVVPAEEAGAPYRPAENRAKDKPRAETPPSPSENSPPRRGDAVHANDIRPTGSPDTPNTGNPKADQKYQQQQEKLRARQDQERQKLQQQQEQDHQRLEQQKADETSKRQMEQQHQQQTRQMQQEHEKQQQKVQGKQQPARTNKSKPPKEDRPPGDQV
ncbi:MAG: YXWGXW repeat-containing protein [Acidobacteriia bacterium]|nr:YXWGXW repeat-containing protein [Terriglobia bacterium]